MKKLLQKLGLSYFKRIVLARLSYVGWLIKGKADFAPSIAKQKCIRTIAKQSNIKVFVETGTYMGDTISALKSNFTHLYSIELAKSYYEAAVHRFRQDSNISIVYGDSGVELSKILAQLNQPAIFWLDGHYSGGDTARAAEDSPLRKEISAILNWKYGPESIVLVDDAHLFTGQNGYPTIDEVKLLSGKVSMRITFELGNNIIMIKK